MDTVFGLTCPRTTSTGHQQRIGHGCTHVLTIFFFFFLWKMMNMVGTQLGHDLCPKRKLKCIVPLMTISSHTNLLLLLQFLDLFLFYGFSPFTLFHWFVCVCLLLFCLPHNHMKSSFISNLHVNKRCEIGASFQIFVFYDLKSTTHPASQLTFYNSFFII